MKVVVTNGCFDILHIGHIELLKKSKQLGDYLIVLLNSDKSVINLKGSKRPINNQYDRKILLESIRYVDEVIIYDDLTPIKLIERIKPDILTKGSDYTIEKIVGYDFVKSYGGKVVTIDFVTGYSTSKIINKI